MIHYGKYNTLKVSRICDFGAILASDTQEILLPRKEMPEDITVGTDIEIFAYFDSEDRPVATSRTPRITLHSFAPLTVVEVTSIGVFCDWGLAKDLLIPFSHMFSPLKKDEQVVVYLCYDEKTDRLFGSTRLAGHLTYSPEDTLLGTSVSALVYHTSEQGSLAVVENSYAGMISSDESRSRNLRPGSQHTVFVTFIHDDGKMDLSFAPANKKARDEAADTLLRALDSVPEGFLPVHDKSSPEQIQRLFSMSKKTFKKSLGRLIKEKAIVYHPGTGIQLPTHTGNTPNT
jgi:predicted RNA-binding protein (virulence factor B family)